MGDNINQELLTEMVKARKSRKRSFWLKLILFSFIALMIVGSFFSKKDGAIFKSHVALVQIKGVIGEGQDVEAEPIVAVLKEALENDLSTGVILELNSPGGSPVQSAIIYDAILELRDKHANKKIYCMVTDMAASGGYYIAAACEKIYANRASLIGSIGVVMSGLSGFGFTEAMKSLGVERRMMTAGEHKGFLDPFSPVDDIERAHTQSMLDNLHKEFIQDVKKGRGTALKDNGKLFSGFIWSANKAIGLGLIDGLSSRSKLAKETFKQTNIYDYTPRKDPFAELWAYSKMMFGRFEFLKNVNIF